MAVPISLERQAALVTRWYPKVKTRYVARDGSQWLCFELMLQPTPSSAKYRVLFAYALAHRPHVYVIDPEPAKESGGVATPHLNSDGTLCLYDPTQDQWSPADALIDTIVQWTSRWLFHYEHWLAFGEWRGDHDTQSASTDDATAGYAATEVP